MINTLKEAIREVENLPEADQETIGRRLLSHVEKLRQLRIEIDKGIRSLNVGKGRNFDLQGFIKKQRASHGKA